MDDRYGEKQMHLRNKLSNSDTAVSEVISYLLVFSLLVVILGLTIFVMSVRIDSSLKNAEEAQYHDIADRIADAIEEAQWVGETFPDSTYQRKIVLPRSINTGHQLIPIQKYIIEVTNDTVYVNSTDHRVEITTMLGGTEFKSIPISGSATSQDRAVLVIYKDNKIEVKGED